MINSLTVPLAEFKLALKPFSAKRFQLSEALLAFEGGFLSLESGEFKAVMRATGEWIGRLQFSPEILRAIATIPPSQDPVVISYSGNQLKIGGIAIHCRYLEIQFDEDDYEYSGIDTALNPGIIDILAMERNAPRATVAGMGKLIRSARLKMERRIKISAVQLIDLGISEAEIRTLVETKIQQEILFRKKETVKKT